MDALIADQGYFISASDYFISVLSEIAKYINSDYLNNSELFWIFALKQESFLRFLALNQIEYAYGMF